MSIDACLEELKQDLAQQLRVRRRGAQVWDCEEAHSGGISPGSWKDILWRAWAEIFGQNPLAIASGGVVLINGPSVRQARKDSTERALRAMDCRDAHAAGTFGASGE